MIFASGGMGAEADALAMMVILTIAFVIIVDFIALIYTARAPASRVPMMLAGGSIVAVILSTLMTMMPSGGLTFCIGMVLVLLTLPCFALCRVRYNKFELTPASTSSLTDSTPSQPPQYPYPPISSANNSLMASLTVTIAIMFFTCLGCCGLSIPGMPILDQILAGRAYSDIRESDVPVGMTKEELIARFGQPHSSYRDDYWSYKKSMSVYVTIYFDKDGKVTKANEWID